jgi:hypothetical protein
MRRLQRNGRNRGVPLGDATYCSSRGCRNGDHYSTNHRFSLVRARPANGLYSREGSFAAPTWASSRTDPSIRPACQLEALAKTILNCIGRLTLGAADEQIRQREVDGDNSYRNSDVKVLVRLAAYPWALYGTESYLHAQNPVEQTSS